MTISNCLLFALVCSFIVGSTQQSLDCNFDSGNLCSWANLGYAPLKWSTVQAQYNGWQSWAKTDHTTNSGSGRYAYLQTYDAYAKSRGDLFSPLMPSSSSGCLTFWYNMAQTTGTLSVLLVKKSDSTAQTVFVRDGSQGGIWLKGRVSVSVDSDYYIVFRHTRGDLSVETGVAIDDVKFTSGPCSSATLECGKNRYGTRDVEGIPEENPEAGPENGEEDQLVRRIIQGQISPQGHWPWIVHIRTFPGGAGTGSYMQCGGTLIDRQWVLTAAHCFETDSGTIKDPEKVFLYFGEANTHYSNIEQSQFSMKPKAVIIHPDRRSGSHRYDITLLKLPYKVNLNDNINIACLPGAPLSAGTQCVAAGWGLDRSGSTTLELKHIDMHIVSQRECGYLSGDQLCAIANSGYGDVCQGDSGGPLVCKNSNRNNAYELAGAVSYGAKCADQERTPGVYADVYFFKPWIQTTMDNY